MRSGHLIVEAHAKTNVNLACFFLVVLLCFKISMLDGVAQLWEHSPQWFCLVCKHLLEIGVLSPKSVVYYVFREDNNNAIALSPFLWEVRKTPSSRNFRTASRTHTPRNQSQLSGGISLSALAVYRICIFEQDLTPTSYTAWSLENRHRLLHYASRGV